MTIYFFGVYPEGDHTIIASNFDTLAQAFDFAVNWKWQHSTLGKPVRTYLKQNGKILCSWEIK